jgi:hypothetical protein
MKKLTFEQYHAKNPQIYRAYTHYAFEAIHSRATSIGSKAICERIRWDAKIDRNDDFKVNNNYTADYARKFEADFPEYTGFFEFRTCKPR